MRIRVHGEGPVGGRHRLHDPPAPQLGTGEAIPALLLQRLQIDEPRVAGCSLLDATDGELRGRKALHRTGTRRLLLDVMRQERQRLLPPIDRCVVAKAPIPRLDRMGDELGGRGVVVELGLRGANGCVEFRELGPLLIEQCMRACPVAHQLLADQRRLHKIQIRLLGQDLLGVGHGAAKIALAGHDPGSETQRAHMPGGLGEHHRQQLTGRPGTPGSKPHPGFDQQRLRVDGQRQLFPQSAEQIGRRRRIAIAGHGSSGSKDLADPVGPLVARRLGRTGRNIRRRQLGPDHPMNASASRQVGRVRERRTVGAP